ncbi:MAG: hypothetical protein L0Y66_21580 [Myxococcaceae bacterium]|nr:hypothetical protein [Myxococcaceae bacterium]MCI0672451.1 hypothetical protein [Myxococcaceae bacterium]
MAAELMRTHFHPYDARVPRLLLAVVAAGCLGLVAWAVRNALTGVEPYAWARAGVAALLWTSLVVSLLRLRPRDGFGVLLTSPGVVLSRPLYGGPIELAWRQVQRLSREGRRRDRLVLVLQEGMGRVVIPRLLFPSREAFEALAQDLESHLPRGPFDA